MSKEIKLETFQVTKTNIGERLTYSVTEIISKGDDVEVNTGNRRTIPVITDNQVKECIKVIQDYILERENK